MNGLVAYQGDCTKEVFARVKAAQATLGHGVSATQCGNVLLCRLQLKSWVSVDKGAPYTDKTTGLTAVVDGYFREGYDGKVAANLSKEAIRLYRAYGRDLVKHISGEFNIAIHDQGQLHVFNDRFGVRVMYYAKSGPHFMVTTGIRYLIEIQIFKKELNRVFALNYLMFNKFRPSADTIYKDIYVYPAATAAMVYASKARYQKYWRMRFTYARKKPVDVSHLVDVFRKADKRALSAHGKKPVVSLSGGLDSRLIVAGLNQKQASRLGAMTWGRPDSQEVQLAQQVAQAAGIPFHAVPLSPSDFIEHARQGFQINDEIDLFVQGITAHGCEPMAKRYDVVLVGIIFDALLGGSHLDEHVFQLKNSAEVLAYVQRKYALVDKTIGVASSQLHKDCYGEVIKRFKQSVNALGKQPAPMLFDSLFLESAAHRLIFLRYRFYRHFVETATPMYDYELVDAISAVPLDQRYRHKVFQQVLIKLSPTLAKIPYQRTLLPADVPVKYWAQANDIQKQTARLYEKIMGDQTYKGKLEYNRHYSNWEAWSRRDKNFRSYIDNVINREDMPIYQWGLVSQKKLKQRWHEHQTGKANHAQLLLHVVSLNGFIETYFKP